MKKGGGRAARDPDSSDRLDRGRQAYERREFALAFEAFSEADRERPLRADDLDRMAMAAALIGRDEEAGRGFERAHHAHLEQGHTVAAARSAIWLAFRLVGAGQHGRANGWLARAKRLLDGGGHDCVERGFLLLPDSRRHLEARDFDTARTIAVEAARIGERFGNADLVAFAHNLQGQALLRGQRIQEGLALLDEAMVAVSSGELSPLITGIIYCSVIQSCQDVYAVERAREWTNALKAWCDSQPGDVAFSGACLVHRSEILQLNGEWPDAIAEARRASARLLAGSNERAAAPAFYQQAELHRLRGELKEAEEAYSSASRWGREPQPGLALLRLAQGRVEAAASAMRRVVAAAGDPMQRVRLLPAHVEIMLAAGDLEEARGAAAELEEAARNPGTEVLVAMAAHARGSVSLAEGDARSALEPLRHSFEIWQRLGAPYLAARVRVLIAQACREVRDDDGCRLECEAAAAVFRQVGAAPDLARIEAAKSGWRTAGRPHRLTARELQVLRLIAAGKTNKTIGTELFLSEKTIDRHVSNIFDKLDVSSRAAATAFAYEHGLI
jgi:ATP/maltotriose-dependent transcriptional regulator MalT